MAGNFCLSAVFFCSLLLCVLTEDISDPKRYIVYMGSSGEKGREAHATSHAELLSSVLGSDDHAKQSLIHSYTYAFSGFAAVLSDQQANALSEKAGVLSVFPDSVLKLHTTQSWDYLHIGLEMAGGSLPNPSSASEQDVIIGFLDTGIWPEAASFSDKGIGPVPSRWKGVCMKAQDFNASSCNRKIIGGRYYEKGRAGSLDDTNSVTPRDKEGHGTHVASTAAGSMVPNANKNGLLNGTARGGSPGSRIAMYSVCTAGHGCISSEILAAFDDAVNDRVDILSVSIGMNVNLNPDYFKDPIAIGAFHATQKGILVVASAGNDGPDPQTVVNTAPWIFTVAANTINREFGSNVILGNGKIIQGEAITFSNLSVSAIYPLVYGGNIPAASTSPEEASRCGISVLDPSKVKGNIVLCRQGSDDLAVRFKVSETQSLGAAGMIMVYDSKKSVAFDYDTFPGTTVSTTSGADILSYINSTSKPVATITTTKVIQNFKPAPVVAYFSSRGPGKLTQNVLKPDISAPGVNILAAWKPSSSFNILSGTSMSTPHVSGTAAFLKSKHPTWSSSVIRSALITTATSMNNMGNPITNDTGNVASPFDLGAGEINPVAALQPGLVYETTTEDYFHFLCNYGLDSRRIKAIAGNSSFVCPSGAKMELISNMNYPTFAIAILNATTIKTLSRTVTNLGADEETSYKVSIDAPAGLNVNVSPNTLTFSKGTNKLSFKVTFGAASGAGTKKGYAFGSLTWANGKHTVRTPFAVNIG